MRCPSCSAHVPAGETICLECGTELVIARPAAPAAPVARAPQAASGASGVPASEGPTPCPDCGESVRADKNGLCPVCGHDFSVVAVIDEREFFREPPTLDQLRAAQARSGAAAPAFAPAPVPVPPGASVRAPAEPFATAERPVASLALPGDRNRARFRDETGPAGSPVVASAELRVEGGQKVFFDGAMTDRVPLDVDQLIIGRRDPVKGHYPDVDLTHFVALDPHISRRHARIFRAQGGWHLEDLCENDATFLNDKAHVLNRATHRLRNGDRVFISDAVALVFADRSDG